jgi:hypothetical protein
MTHKRTPKIVYRPTADELRRVANEIARFLESNFKAARRAGRSKRVPLTPEERAEDERRVAEGMRIVRLLRRDPARLSALDLRIAISIEELKKIESMAPADRYAFTAARLGMAVLDRIRDDSQLLTIMVEDPK